MKFLFLVIAVIIANQSVAQEMRSISVDGSSKIEVVPDRARISVGVRVVDLDPQIAMNDLARRSNDIVDTVKAAGISSNNVQTSQLSLRPNWNGEKNAGFVASNQLSIEVLAIDEMPALLSALAQVGMNDLGNLQFYSSKAEELERDAMLGAVEDARSRAEILATAVGMKLGNPITIDYGFRGGQAAPRMMAASMERASANVALEQGSIGISSHVAIKFELVNE